MQCLSPNKGHYKPDGTHKFGPSPTGHETEHDIPCGYCDICRTNKAKLRGFKSFTNTLYTESNMFLTLTYGKHYPITPSGLATLDKSAVPRFIKRLRKYIKKTSPDITIGVLYNGEYGDEKDARPHYHIIIYNYSFPDQYYWRTTPKGYPQNRSKILETLWPYGHAEIGTVTAASATYVSSYIYKKQYGKNKKEHYKDRVEEYVVTPKRNYVTGREFIRKNIDNIANHGCFKTIEGHSIGIDKHTMNWIEKEFPEHALKIKLQKESFTVRKATKQQLEATKKHLEAKKQLKKELKYAR